MSNTEKIANLFTEYERLVEQVSREGSTADGKLTEAYQKLEKVRAEFYNAVQGRKIRKLV